LIDTFNNTNILSNESKVKFNLNIFGSSFATIFDYAVTEKKNKDKNYLIKDVKEKQIISSEEIKKFKEIENYSLVIIVLESFGKSSSSVLNQYIENHIKFKLNDDFKIKFLETKRYGHTMQGEIQILCNILINNLQNMKNFNFNKYNCLPNEIKNHNIKTYAYHGFSSKFFDRYKWWKNIGFENRYFFDDLSDLQKKCGTFLVGKCDEDMIKLVFNDIRNENGFYYLLTLNTHYPYSKKLKNNKLKEICKVHKIEDAICSIYQIYSDNLSHILYQINNSDKNLKVIITGDHKPPFTNKKENFYFTENIVPTIIITYEK
jgi:phosphoglycerol transferase MdoB-like AlkP superfamily enzyme